MLFDAEVLEFAEAHFVPVIADHPMGSTEPKRNPEMWALSESWKRSPNGSQLVWLVSADKSRRAGIVYSDYKDPVKLLAWMEAVAVFDGRVDNATDQQKRAAVISHLRSELHGLWRSPDRKKFDREFHQMGIAFDGECGALADDQLCREADASTSMRTLASIRACLRVGQAPGYPTKCLSFQVYGSQRVTSGAQADRR